MEFSMAQPIDNFKDNTVQIFRLLAASGKEVGTFDRSTQKFGETDQAQLKGRARVITQSLTVAALATLFVAFGTYQCIMHPAGAMYFLTGSMGLCALIALKEAAVQSIARSREKQKFKIEEETEDTQYHFWELVNDTAKANAKAFENFKKRIFNQTNAELQLEDID